MGSRSRSPGFNDRSQGFSDRSNRGFQSDPQPGLNSILWASCLKASWAYQSLHPEHAERQIWLWQKLKPRDFFKLRNPAWLATSLFLLCMQKSFPVLTDLANLLTPVNRILKLEIWHFMLAKTCNVGLILSLSSGSLSATPLHLQLCCHLNLVMHLFACGYRFLTCDLVH